MKYLPNEHAPPTEEGLKPHQVNFGISITDGPLAQFWEILGYSY